MSFTLITGIVVSPLLSFCVLRRSPRTMMTSDRIFPHVGRAAAYHGQARPGFPYATPPRVSYLTSSCEACPPAGQPGTACPPAMMQSDHRMMAVTLPTQSIPVVLRLVRSLFADANVLCL